MLPSGESCLSVCLSYLIYLSNLFHLGVLLSSKAKRAKCSTHKQRVIIMLYNKVCDVVSNISELLEIQLLTDTTILQVKRSIVLCCPSTYNAKHSRDIENKISHWDQLYLELFVQFKPPLSSDPACSYIVLIVLFRSLYFVLFPPSLRFLQWESLHFLWKMSVSCSCVL